MKSKRIIALVTAMLTAASLASCNSSSGTPQSSAPNSSTPQSSEPSSSGGSESSSAPGAGSGPVSGDPITLRVLARTPSFYPNQDFGQVGNMMAYEEMTNIHIEWENVDPGVFNNTLAAAIASDTLPDVILKGSISNTNLSDWGSQGILVDLSGYIDEYAPNFKKLMDENDGIAQAITSPEGGIYGLPQVILSPAMRAPTKLYINKKALAAAEVELPKTMDEFYDMLVAMRDADYNGNGQKDEIPFIAGSSFYTGFHGSFGLRTRGAHHDIVDADPETHEVRIFAATENYRKFLEFMAKMYQNGVVYPEIFTEGVKNVSVLAAEQKLGVIMDTTLYNVPTEYVDDWEGLKLWPAGPDGYDIASNVRSVLHSVGNFAITADCEYPERALQWADYFYSEEGSLFYHAGVEGVNWEKKSDGTLGYTDETQATRTAEMTQDSFIAQFAMWPGGRNPAVMLDNLWGGEYEAEPAATASALLDYASDTIWPFFAWTDEENEVIGTIHDDIKSYITSSTAQIVAGEVQLTDEWWNSFVAQIESMDADKVIDAYTSALTRVYGDSSKF
ncbi:MAG: extracellular solute-binding protein [Oscillospiraceae bacterium]|jgi:putative aldouronate transport system substrate-binding protein|nr:extracellular solute-binding protein [Oscillospiraceae bacterium]